VEDYTITKVVVHTDRPISLGELTNLFNNIQGCLSMGHDDARFILDEKFNIEFEQMVPNREVTHGSKKPGCCWTSHRCLFHALTPQQRCHCKVAYRHILPVQLNCRASAVLFGEGRQNRASYPVPLPRVLGIILRMTTLTWTHAQLFKRWGTIVMEELTISGYMSSIGG
jgi:hypothetical protein